MTAKMLTHDGKTMCHKDWAAHIGITPQTLAARFRYGWTVEEALTPIRRSQNPEAVLKRALPLLVEALNMAKLHAKMFGEHGFAGHLRQKVLDADVLGEYEAKLWKPVPRTPRRPNEKAGA
jgi:hypothetical protein